tara:strand:- start:15 stop:176 length:162 start_codon:yes stop_codon:yes gene_type:complete
MKALLTMKSVKTRYFMILMAFLVSAVSGCATMEGAGEDIESAGEEIQEAANDN